MMLITRLNCEQPQLPVSPGRVALTFFHSNKFSVHISISPEILHSQFDDNVGKVFAMKKEETLVKLILMT